MQSAPAAIPAMIEVSLPTGFTPADLTRVEAMLTFSSISFDKPATSASAITGTSPACDTRCSSSKAGSVLSHGRDNLTDSAFPSGSDQCVNNTDSPCQKGTFTSGAPQTHQPDPRIQA